MIVILHFHILWEFLVLAYVQPNEECASQSTFQDEICIDLKGEMQETRTVHQGAAAGLRGKVGEIWREQINSELENYHMHVHSQYCQSNYIRGVLQ